MEVKVVVQNMKHNAWGRAKGDTEPTVDRLPLLTERLASAEADLIILNETRSRARHAWPQSWRARIRKLARDLDMRAAPITPSRNKTPSALLYRPATVGTPTWWDTSQIVMFAHGYGTAAFKLADLPLPLTVGAVHFTPFSPQQAASEAHTLVCRVYRKGSIGIMGGDFNFPMYGAEPDWANALPHNIMNRAVIEDGRPGALADIDLWLPDGTLNPDVKLEPNFVIADILARGDMHDTAWEMFKRSRDAGQPDRSLLAHTGITDRIDVIAVTGALRPAVTGYGLLDQPAGASDHHGVWCTIQTELYNRKRVFQYQ